jgi:hypothetical protein
MYAFAKIFPADVRKKVAQTDWQADGRFFAAQRHSNMCPIGMALTELGVVNKEGESGPIQSPSAGHFLQLWALNAEKFAGGTLSYTDYPTYWNVQFSSQRFMAAFDAGHLTNEAVARAFGYPKLAATR